MFMQARVCLKKKIKTRFINVTPEHRYHVTLSQMSLTTAAHYILILEASK